VDGFVGALDFRLNDEDLGVIEPALPESMTIIQSEYCGAGCGVRVRPGRPHHNPLH
jgi:hypothetical protein